MPFTLSQYIRWILKISVTVIILAYLVWTINSYRSEYEKLFNSFFQTKNSLLLIVLFVLMLVNWSFEALKWKLLASKVEEISFLKALKSVFVGISIGVLTPKSVGDCVGRFLLLRSFKKYRLLGALLLGQAFQLTATLLFGVPAAWYYFRRIDDGFVSNFVLALMFLLLSVVAIRFRKTLLTAVFETQIGIRIKTYLVVVKEYSPFELFKISMYSIFRYLVFTVQYILVLQLFHVGFSFVELFLLVSVVYLIKSMLFSINFVADMGMRQITAVSVMGMVGVAESSTVMASFAVWAINIGIPAVIGLFYWIQLKLKW